MATHAPTATAPGLLEVEDGTYRNGKAAARFLSGPARTTCVPSCGSGTRSATRPGPGWPRPWPAGRRGRSSSSMASFSRWRPPGSRRSSPGRQPRCPRCSTSAPHQRLLDVGGGTGSWSIAIAQRHQHLTGAVLELPTAVELARTRVDAAELGHRITVITGDVYSVEEARAWLDHTGWRFTDHRPLAGP